MNNNVRNRKTKKHQPHPKKPEVNASGTDQRKWIWLALAVVFLTTFAVYFKAIKFDLLMTWDDYLYITENSHIKDLYWTNIKQFFTNYYVNNYQPLTMLFYAAEYKIGSGHAALFHFNNILLHLLNTYLVFILIKRISPKNMGVALITAAFFAIHPMHVESVAWVAERKDVLYSFFFLFSLILYCDYLKSQKIKFLLFAFILFVLSCLSKSAAVILPLVMLLFDYYTHRKYDWKMIAEKVPFFAISLVFGFIAIQSQKGAIQDMAPVMSVIEHISVVSFSFISYLVKAIIPVNLSVIYPYPKELGTTLPVIYYLSIAGVGFLMFLLWYSLKYGKAVVFGILFFTLTILLVLQLFPVGAAAMADRYTYIPYIGLFFIIGKLFEYLSASVKTGYKKYSNYLLLALTLSFVILSSISYGRVKIWENDEMLFSDAKSKYPYSSISYFVIGDYNLAYYRLNAANNSKREIYLKNAFIEYENALKLSLTRADKLKACYNLGTVKGYWGDFAGAILDYDKAINLDSNYTNAYINRGNARRELKDYEAALADLDKAIGLSPQNTLAISNRGITKYNINDYDGALEDFDKAVKIDINNPKAYNDRGSAKFMLKNYEGALEDYNKAIELNPQYTDAINNRDMVLSILGNTKK